ncbi:hypothetical protein O3P69_007493 [Scylla paramamosain]|uniref:Uncharacterized protein n=1 Tax=Scylla paramamosain TaxID=85552 RepID=A0AAW0V4M2_SCYPA
MLTLDPRTVQAGLAGWRGSQRPLVNHGAIDRLRTSLRQREVDGASALEFMRNLLISALKWFGTTKERLNVGQQHPN